MVATPGRGRYAHSVEEIEQAKPPKPPHLPRGEQLAPLTRSQLDAADTHSSVVLTDLDLTAHEAESLSLCSARLERVDLTEARLRRLHLLHVLLDRCNRHDAVVGLLQMQPRLFRAYRAGLDEEDAGDDLQAVCDTMLHFLQQHFLLS